MPRSLIQPIIYLITSGSTTTETTTNSPEFDEVLTLVSAAVRANVPLLQIREKNLTDRTLFDLSLAASAITEGSGTRLLVNRRADIARAANADGVHLPEQALDIETVRRTFGESLMVGVSTHSLSELIAAQEASADFAVYGPVFETPSKQGSIGLQRLQEATSRVPRFPVVALGGINASNALGCFRAGATGVAGIRLFSNPETLELTVRILRKAFEEVLK